MASSWIYIIQTPKSTKSIFFFTVFISRIHKIQKSFDNSLISKSDNSIYMFTTTTYVPRTWLETSCYFDSILNYYNYLNNLNFELTQLITREVFAGFCSKTKSEFKLSRVDSRVIISDYLYARKSTNSY